MDSSWGDRGRKQYAHKWGPLRRETLSLEKQGRLLSKGPCGLRHTVLAVDRHSLCSEGFLFCFCCCFLFGATQVSVAALRTFRWGTQASLPHSLGDLSSPTRERTRAVSSALAGGFLTAAPPGEPFSPSCKDMALDLRSTLIQCDLTLIHFVSKDTVSKQGPTMDFWVDLNFVVTLFIQRIWKLKSNPHPKCEVPTPFPTENISEGTWICFV